MNSTELLTTFRSEMSDGAAPYLWSDSEAYAYFDDAQNTFCRLTNGLSDARTAAVTQVAVVPSTQWYNTHTAILKVRTAQRGDTGRDVELVNAEHMSQFGIVFDGRTGPLKYLVVGLEAHAVRAWPVPNETVTVNLSVFRLPLTSITAAAQAFELDAQHHRHLLLWAKHLAYDKQDAETFDRRKSDDFAARFRAYCDDAKKEQDRARRVVGTVAYGGI